MVDDSILGGIKRGKLDGAWAHDAAIPLFGVQVGLSHGCFRVILEVDDSEIIVKWPDLFMALPIESDGNSFFVHSR